MNGDRPYVVVIGGPNGAGKTTVARQVLPESFRLTEFVNADTIAQGLSGVQPERSAFEAGRIMLGRLRALAAERASFAFESTLASRSFAPWLMGLVSFGYDIHLIYVWLRSPDLAVRRVRKRVRLGGHSVPDDDIRRRFTRSARNLLSLYLPIATSWRLFENSRSNLRAIAERSPSGEPTIINPVLWKHLHANASIPRQRKAEDLG